MFYRITIDRHREFLLSIRKYKDKDHVVYLDIITNKDDKKFEKEFVDNMSVFIRNSLLIIKENSKE